MDYIITFANTNYAIKAEQCLLDHKQHASVLPLPPQIKSGCGICLRVDPGVIKTALKLFTDINLKEYALFFRTKKHNRFAYTEIEKRGVLVEQNAVSLMENCTTGGCGAKISPGDLSGLLRGLPAFTDEKLLVGYDSSDDAGVYKLNETQSIVTTVDFFPPMIDEPRTFGRIAAANALSDIYAMGGRPITALNLVCFPQSMDMEILREILAGGAEKVLEASAVLAGGHSIYDKSAKYGLAVTGIVENDRIIRNNTPETGHKLILTKPLGTGLIMAALRADAADGEAVGKAVASMERLNRYVAEKMRGFAVSACTDITGFGLLAHTQEMVSDRVSALIYPYELPYFEEAYRYADKFMLTAAGQRNRNYLAGKADLTQIPFALQELMFDPQTSGGLLICAAPEQSEDLLASIQSEDPSARIIGEIVKREKAAILFT